jgi:hypothetical protein
MLINYPDPSGCTLTDNEHNDIGQDKIRLQLAPACHAGKQIQY